VTTKNDEQYKNRAFFKLGDARLKEKVTETQQQTLY
jgi:hypothetical protein